MLYNTINIIGAIHKKLTLNIFIERIIINIATKETKGLHVPQKKESPIAAVGPAITDFIISGFFIFVSLPEAISTIPCPW